MMSNKTMEARVKLETQGLKPKEVTELFLDNCRASQLEGLTEEYSELEILSMINLGLTTLKGFPAYPKLRSLEISDNKLVGDLEYLKGCPNLTSLKICNNRITEIKALEPLKELKNLTSLDLIECPISEGTNYRTEVFEAVPQLTFLDGIDREGTAEPESDEDFELDEEENLSGSDEGSGEDSGEESGDDEGDEGFDEEAEDEPAAKRAKVENEETNGEANGEANRIQENGEDSSESKEGNS